MSRVYFHIDMNAFFVNAEILLDPSLKGKPVAVSGLTRRSVISTASYEARQFGVNSAMPVQIALKHCPGLLVIPGHHRYYEELSKQFMDIVRSYTTEVEQASIDECYADVTETIKLYEKPLMLAVEIQQRILKEVGLPCSIGVAPNMFLAKMASDMKKPMGITVLRLRDVEQKLWPLPIGDMRGVGKKTEPLLKDIGIQTIGDLARCERLEILRPIFGKNSEGMIQRAHGYDSRMIVKEWNAKSMSVSETFLEDINDYEEIRGMFRTLSRRLGKRMREDRKFATSLSVRIRYGDFRNRDRSIKIDGYIWKNEDIFNRAMTLFEDTWDEKPVRLVGIALSGLKNMDECFTQIDLFNPVIEDHEETGSVIKDLNRMLKEKKFIRASELLKGKK